MSEEFQLKINGKRAHNFVMVIDYKKTAWKINGLTLVSLSAAVTTNVLRLCNVLPSKYKSPAVA